MEKNFKGIKILAFTILFSCIFQAVSSCRYKSTYAYQPKDYYSRYTPGSYASPRYGRYDRYTPQAPTQYQRPYSRRNYRNYDPIEKESQSVYVVPNYSYGKSTNQIGGHKNIVEGRHNRVYGQQNKIYGQRNSLDGERNKICGCRNDVDGVENGIYGKRNHVRGEGNLVGGYRNRISGLKNTVSGQGNLVEGTGNIVVSGDACQEYYAY